MQAGKKLPKWQSWARMGINLGVSNQHARSVALVLNMTTGHMSSQFHVKFIAKFETVRKNLGNELAKSNWQSECGFRPRPTVVKKKQEGKEQ
jgi:hypothetical protein